MSNAYEEASRFADHFEGFDLVAYEPVAVPAFVVTLEVIVQRKKPIPPIDEFALRMVNAGLVSLDGVSGLLGLEARLAESSLLNQLQAGTLASRVVSQGGRALTVTPRGEAAIRDLAAYSPERQEIYVVYDRVTRQISGTDDRGLLRPHELEFRSLRAKPPVGPPRLEDVPVDDLAAALAKSEGLRRVRRNAQAEFQVVGVKRVTRSERRYKKATLLIYRERKRGVLTFGLVMDGRPSKPHIAAIQDLGGLKYLELPRSAFSGRSHYKKAVAAIPTPLRESISDGAENQDLLRSFVRAWRRLSDPDIVMESAEPDGNGMTARDLARASYLQAGSRLQKVPARTIPAWEHGLLLDWVLATARTRVLIASDSITDAAVSYDLVRKLEDTSSRGIVVSIVIPPKSATGQSGSDGRTRLSELVARRSRLVVVESPSAHPLLLWDDSWVSGCFPWLGYVGDPERGLVNHESVVVNDRASTSATLQQATSAFGLASGSPDR